MKTTHGGKEVELTVKRDGTVLVDGTKVGLVQRDESAPAAGFAAYAEGKRLAGDVKIGDALMVWAKKGDAVSAVLLAVSEAREERRRESEAQMRRDALVAAAVLNVVAEADDAAPLPMTEWSRRRFESELADPRTVGFSVSVELEVQVERGRETVDASLDLGRWGNRDDRGKVNWSGTGRTPDEARAAISLYQMALDLVDRMKDAADAARAALKEDRCPVHGDEFSDDGTCQSCFQDYLASEVTSG